MISRNIENDEADNQDEDSLEVGSADGPLASKKKGRPIASDADDAANDSHRQNRNEDDEGRRITTSSQNQNTVMINTQNKEGEASATAMEEPNNSRREQQQEEEENQRPIASSSSSFQQQQSNDPDQKKEQKKKKKRHGAQNHDKMKLFVRWLQSTFPDAFVDEEEEHSQSQQHILDIAGGGRGELATRLAYCCQRRVCIVDPRPNQARQTWDKVVLKKLPKKWQQRATPAKADAVFHSKVRQLECYFTYEAAVGEDVSVRQTQTEEQRQTPLEEKSDQTPPINNSDRANNNILPSSSSSTSLSVQLRDAIHNASLLVGMHADSATEAILDAALHFQKPFVVVPCCVFPNFFRERRVWRTVVVENDDNGKNDNSDVTEKNNNSSTHRRQAFPVRSHQDFCEYLLQKDERLQSCELPFPGRNVAIYWDGK